MEIYKTIRLKLTEEELKAIQTFYNMLNELDSEEEEILADYLGYSDLNPFKDDLEQLWELAGKDLANL